MSFLRHGESIDPMNVFSHWEQASGSLPVLIGLGTFLYRVARERYAFA